MIGMFTCLWPLLLSVGLAVAAPIDSADIHVIDGDTIGIHHKQPVCVPKTSSVLIR